MTWVPYTLSEEHPFKKEKKSFIFLLLQRKSILWAPVLPCSLSILLPKSKANPNSTHLNFEPHTAFLSSFNGNCNPASKSISSGRWQSCSEWPSHRVARLHAQHLVVILVSYQLMSWIFSTAHKNLHSLVWTMVSSMRIHHPLHPLWSEWPYFTVAVICLVPVS